MNETNRIVWATTFAQVFLQKRDYDLAVMKAAEAVVALTIASDNSIELKPGTRRELLEQFTKR